MFSVGVWWALMACGGRCSDAVTIDGQAAMLCRNEIGCVVDSVDGIDADATVEMGTLIWYWVGDSLDWVMCRR